MSHSISIRLHCKRSVAHSSPDHIVPWGTKRDNSRNQRFNDKLYKLYHHKKEPIKVLDMGCSGGGFVKNCIDQGCLAVGLEGSDFSKRIRRAEWATIPEYLFTCDITAPFQVEISNNGDFQPMIFDVVTSWEVMEHIAESDLEVVSQNVMKHLAPDGLWIMSVSPNDDVIQGVQLHQTVQKRGWWINKFKNLGFEHCSEYVNYFNTQFVRGPKYNAPGSFHLILKKTGQASPPIPTEKYLLRLYDKWLGSLPQRLLKLLIYGI